MKKTFESTQAVVVDYDENVRSFVPSSDHTQAPGIIGMTSEFRVLCRNLPHQASATSSSCRTFFTEKRVCPRISAWIGSALKLLVHQRRENDDDNDEKCWKYIRKSGEMTMMMMLWGVDCWSGWRWMDRWTTFFKIILYIYAKALTASAGMTKRRKASGNDNKFRLLDITKTHKIRHFYSFTDEWLSGVLNKE